MGWFSSDWSSKARERDKLRKLKTRRQKAQYRKLKAERRKKWLGI